MHVNTGASYQPALNANSWTWGVGTEWDVVSGLAAIAEVYGTHRTNSNSQVGLRYVVPQLPLSFDFSYGRTWNHMAPDWVAFGINLLA